MRYLCNTSIVYHRSPCHTLRYYTRDSSLSVVTRSVVVTTKLTLHMDKILTTQYSTMYCTPNDPRHRNVVEVYTLLNPTKFDIMSSTAEVCDNKLASCLNELPSVAAYRQSRSRDLINDRRYLAIYRAFLHMHYFKIADPQRTSDSSRLKQLRAKSQDKVRLATMEATRIGQELHELDLVRNLPITDITALIPAITTHLLGMKSPSAVSRRLSLYEFC